MNPATTIEMKPDRKILEARRRYAEMTTVELRGELTRLMTETARHLTEIGFVIRTLEEKGDDLSDIRLGMFQYLRKVAYGQLLPEVLEKCLGNSTLLNRVANLAIPDQKRIVVGESIKLVVIEDGHTTHRLCEPLKMRPKEIQQLFAGDHIRDEAEQVSWLNERRPKLCPPKESIEVDAKRGIVIFHAPTQCTLQEMVNLVARITK